MSFTKAIVPLGVGVILYVLSLLGVSGEMSVKETLALLVTAGLVYLIPNRRK